MSELYKKVFDLNIINYPALWDKTDPLFKSNKAKFYSRIQLLKNINALLANPVTIVQIRKSIRTHLALIRRERNRKQNSAHRPSTLPSPININTPINSTTALESTNAKPTSEPKPGPSNSTAIPTAPSHQEPDQVSPKSSPIHPASPRYLADLREICARTTPPRHKMTENCINGSVPYLARTSEELGRYLVAARDLSPGDLVLTERPLVFGPKPMPDPEATMPCVGCYKPVFTDAGERCFKCGWPVCSGNCQGLTDPRHHGIECYILSARPECVLDNMAEYYRHDVLLPLRCILLQTTDPGKWSKLSEMQSHMECRKPGTDAYDEANEYIVEYLMNNFINKLDKDIANKYLPEISSELIHKMCGIIDTNALEIRLPGGAELLALFTNTCIMEHSCIPNTKHTFSHSPKDKNDLYKITVKVVIPVQRDSHITTMYSHALWGTQARRQHLKDTKYFSCRCPRCSDSTELGTYLSAMKCLGDGKTLCDGIHLPENPLDDETDWICNKCSIKINNSQVNMLISQMGEEVENVQMMGGSVSMLENLICRLSTFLHPNHYHLYSLKHSLIQLYGRQPNYMSEDILDKKVSMCKDLIAITKSLDPGNARLSLYNAVLQHELYSALLMKSKKANTDGSKKKVQQIKPLLTEAKLAIKDALDSLKDDMEETSGKKLFEVIKKNKKEFEKYCKEKKINIEELYFKINT